MFVVLKSLAEVEQLLNKMLREQRIVDSKLDVFYAKFPSEADVSESDEAMEEFGDICERLWNLESDLSCTTRTAILMAIIDLESTINQFCYFNLGEATANSIEGLNLSGKLEVTHAVLGLSPLKGTHVDRSLHNLVNWRNAFAHGKCTDMPRNSIKENHLTAPDKFPGPGDEVQEMVTLLHDYLVTCQHLSKITRHQYTVANSVENKEIDDWLRKLRTFHFVEGQIVGRKRPKRS
jgi:hypothetical protein